MKIAVGLALVSALTLCAEEAGKIVRPTDGAALPSTEADIVATAPSGKLQLDGKNIAAQAPFPDVLHAIVKVSPGVHSLVLSWQGGRTETRFSAGANPPAGFTPFRQHPPVAGVQCTQCHELNKRGRFHFKGGCFDCHQQAGFVKLHTHDAARLEQCGMCHNAHGSTIKAHLLFPKEKACKQCHN